MKVLELAKEFDKSSDDILKMLKSLKLKAKGADQELSVAVISVLKSQFGLSSKESVAKKESSEVKPKKATRPAKNVSKKITNKVKEQEKPKKSVKAKGVSDIAKKAKSVSKKTVEIKEEAPKVNSKKILFCFGFKKAFESFFHVIDRIINNSIFPDINKIFFYFFFSPQINTNVKSDDNSF